MIKVPQTFFNKIVERVNTLRTREDMLVFSDKLINNQNSKVISSIVLFSVGSLLTKLLKAPVTNISVELIKDALPIYFREFDKAQNNKQISVRAFRDFEGDYEVEAVRYLNVSLWSWITDTLNYLSEGEVLYMSTKSFRTNAYLTELFKEISSVEELQELADDNLKSYLISEGCSQELTVQLSSLYGVIKKNKSIVNNLFLKQLPVLNDLSIPIKERLEGARIQDFLLNYIAP